jgi:hypothetical protein
LFSLGKLFRASKKTLPNWNELVRHHRQLHHLEIRMDGATNNNENDRTDSHEEESVTSEPDDIDPIDEYTRMFFSDVDMMHPRYLECKIFAEQLAFVYRQELMDIMHLFGLSHESDLWCGNLVNNVCGELVNNAFTELDELVQRTRASLFNYQVSFCLTGDCSDSMPFDEWCNSCQRLQRSISLACYRICYSPPDGERYSAHILSLPWLFTAFLQGRRNKTINTKPVLMTVIHRILKYIVLRKRRVYLETLEIIVYSSTTKDETPIQLELSAAVFIEIIQHCLRSITDSPFWHQVLGQFVQNVRTSQTSTMNSDCHAKLLLRHIDEHDPYPSNLISIQCSEKNDQKMHDYFDRLLEICFAEACRTNQFQYLDITEAIILILQKLAIRESVAFEVA